MSRSFRFGITNSEVGDMAAWTARARDAESLGYATFLMPDTTQLPAPLLALAAAAGATTALRVGTWVLCEPLRNPRQLAWEARTLHDMTGGRFELGLGVGRPGAERDAKQLDVSFGSPGERIARLEATIDLLRDEGPKAPLMIAASGPRLLALAARRADIVALGWSPNTTVEDAKRKVDTVRAEDPDVELAAGMIAVGDEPAPWLERMGVTLDELHDAGAVTVLRGTPQQMSDRLQELREALGISYVTVPAGAMKAFAPVVADLDGR